MRDFQGKTAVVTGAASGIGRGLVDLFASAGMNVVLAGVASLRVNTADTAAQLELAGQAITVAAGPRAEVSIADAVVTVLGTGLEAELLTFTQADDTVEVTGEGVMITLAAGASEIGPMA